jgi:hypothetical protein
MDASQIVSITSATVNVIALLAVLSKWSKWAGIIDASIEDMKYHMRNLPCVKTCARITKDM